VQASDVSAIDSTYTCPQTHAELTYMFVSTKHSRFPSTLLDVRCVPWSIQTQPNRLADKGAANFSASVRHEHPCSFDRACFSNKVIINCATTSSFLTSYVVRGGRCEGIMARGPFSYLVVHMDGNLVCSTTLSYT
jgi:hypothetical protein